MEVLTTVQTIAEDQTEVASKMNTLLSEYQIRTDDIKAYDIATFGTNRFLISVVYILTQLVNLRNVFIRLRSKVVRIASLKRKLSSKFKLRTKTPGFVVDFVRSPITTIALIGPIITIISEKIKYIRRPLVVLNLTLKLGNLKIGKIVKTTFRLTSLLSKILIPTSREELKFSIFFNILLSKILIPTIREELKSLMLFNKHWDAYYNGVPVEL